ncbi:MAG TPA: hypothetical protein DCS55_20805 [Acidimicrobiaceae bacterium]|nr:hypothetical protein [Acidimicrobiaceae bacterium]
MTFEETEEAIARASIEALANRYRSLLGGVGFREGTAGEEAGQVRDRRRPAGAALAEHDAGTLAIVEQEVTGSQFDEPQRTRLRLEAILVETPDGWASPTSRRT